MRAISYSAQYRKDLKKAKKQPKLYGSLVATQHGLYTAQRYLGHSSPQVTAAYYADLIDRPAASWTA